MTLPPGGAEVAARCYRHPNREALIRCTRCDRPICPDCMRPASVGFHCPDDVQQGARSIRAPRTAVGAKLLASPPYVTITLAVLNVAAYLCTALQAHGSLRDPTGSQLFLDWNLNPFSVHSGRYYQLLTSAFLHLSLLHIGANMLALALIGPALERLLGWWRFAAVYLISALGGSAAVYAFGIQASNTAGASGAIFGLFGACLVLVRRLGLDAQWLIGTIVLNFVITFSVPQISKWGHLGGFVTGLLLGVAIAGLPSMRERVPTRVQAAGVGGVLVLVVVVIALRTATW
ncbi:MAG TPA: rhomboid family intramembrane serine protease [Jatrophihabitans sp.]|jgi:membrane associated rhomboid family serine protease|uniref:rhomboid family intramembrane serine protease n=1 Tax=Jatrophihabitans sp. TaxID=1932789 RepID=UPI002DFA948E|nr:rhomboid family intramembrane serine protease [Jatrophihabitans sp.]